MSRTGPPMADTTGNAGSYWDPLWRIDVRLTVVERALLRSWPVRRLAFVAHAGASAVASTQSTSRLEHSLGVLALTARFAPDDEVARVAALLHDVGHLPLSHTLEELAGWDHHELGAQRTRLLAPLLAEHGIDVQDVLDVGSGTRASVLSGAPGALGVDHLDGLVRSASAHGRTRAAPPATLARLEVVDGCVSCDVATADDLVAMVADEARLHCSELNLVTTTVVRRLVTLLLEDAPAGTGADVAAMTDDELWALLLASPSTAEGARALRRDPGAWRVVDVDDPASTHGGVVSTLRRLYLDVPLVDGTIPRQPHPAHADLPAVPWTYAVVPRRAAGS
ncbi:HD domain-containing protein [Pseudokineococcus sp. 5B2Z-1]|uniref:HD domain-containing protein n=1 Tax=Pseudokineococcus sp. 5B2Z-1 TaxID=3132744 RepID=UPI0030A3F991